MDKPHLLQIGPYPAWDEDPLNADFTVHRFWEVEDQTAFLAENGDKIRAIATRGDLGAGGDLIRALPNLEIISVYGVGFDAVDLGAAREMGARVTNTPDVLTEDVADLGVGMMLAQSRNILGASDWVRSGDWISKGGFPLSGRVHGKKAGILGLGRIGHAIGQRLAAFNMQISYTDLGPRDFAPDWTFVADPVMLARDVQFLFVAMAASAETHRMVGKEVLEALGPEGMLINISRASNIDEPALLDALESGALGSAAIDVFEGEPDLDPRFLKLDNCLLQPHHASGTVDTRKAMGLLVRQNLEAHFAGRDLLTPVV